MANRKALKIAHVALTPEIIEEIEELHQEPLHVHLTRVGLTGFLMAVFLLIFHIPSERLNRTAHHCGCSGLDPGWYRPDCLARRPAQENISKVDGESILFFAGLFMLIGGLEKVHLFEKLAEVLAGNRIQPECAGHGLALGTGACERNSR